MSSRSHFDFIIFGAGFGGSIMSMVLRRLGYSVLLLEKGKHPRFAIGESSTPFANLLLEKISEEYSLPALRPLCEWGSWQTNYPQLSVGLKRGFTFYHHTRDRKIDLKNRKEQLLVAASPNNQVADTHWYRPEFDQFLVDEALKIGVDYLDQISISSISKDQHWKTVGMRTGIKHEFSGEYLIDATGANSILATNLGLNTRSFPDFPKTSALFAHFTKVGEINQDDPAIPYPPENAAVHHVFEGGWIWVLRFNNGITSAGAALTNAFASEINLRTGNEVSAWNKLIDQFPSIRALFKSAKAITPFYSIGQISFRRSSVVGDNWALLPSAAGFVDPLLSSGFALTLLGINRLGRLFQKTINPEITCLQKYEAVTLNELAATADLVSALYEKMGKPEDFNLLTLLYFAAMSFTESAHRLGTPELASSYLLNNNDNFRVVRERICGSAKQSKRITRETIDHAIEPIDIVGLRDWKRDNWYPADHRDLLQNYQKLQSTPDKILKMLEKCGISVMPE